MRLRLFTGTSVAHAMDKVRAELGEDAVIVHVDAGKKVGIARVTAAVDQAMPVPAQRPDKIDPPAPSAASLADLPTLLRYHGLPPALTKALSEAAQNFTDMGVHEALAQSLESRFSFRPLRGRVEEQLVLIGAPGQGKTLMAARLAAMAVQAGRKARIITTDGESAGAMAQLTAFCAPLKVEVVSAATPQQAEQQLQARFDGLQIIDTAGINPYALADVEAQARLLSRLHCEPVWVISANTDAQEAADMGEIFASLGAQRFICSRADSTRRFSAVLAVLSRCKLALAGFSDSPFVGDKMQAGNGLSLANRLIDRPDPSLIARYTKVKAA
jgi:flagellar biosynthesis protein FlhF